MVGSVESGVQTLYYVFEIIFMPGGSGRPMSGGCKRLRWTTINPRPGDGDQDMASATLDTEAVLHHGSGPPRVPPVAVSGA